MTLNEITDDIVYNSKFTEGMIFKEFNYYIGILKVDNDNITILEGNDLNNLDYFKYTKDELIERLTYTLFRGCCVEYHETNLSAVDLWFKEKIKTNYYSIGKISKLDNILTK